MGRGRMNSDPFEDYDGTQRRGGMGFGPCHHGLHAHGRRFGRPSTVERIEYLEEFQRDLEEMTEDVASRLAWLRQRESDRATS
jgi:hypothetical protein